MCQNSFFNKHVLPIIDVMGEEMETFPVLLPLVVYSENQEHTSVFTILY